MSQPTNSRSEVHAYRYIFDELVDKKGWSKNQVFTQQEIASIDGIKESLGLLKPENIVQISTTTLYVIEGKNQRNKLDISVSEAEEYANKINSKSNLKAIFITGVAGNDTEGFVAKSKYLKNGKWSEITENQIELTGLLSKVQIDTILHSNNPDIVDVEITSNEFLKAAEEINGIMHDNAINLDYRARFISTLLLALSDGSQINLEEKDSSVLIQTINAKANSILHKHNKSEFSRFIKIDEPSSNDNHIKVRNAIIKIVQALLGLNIRSAMNSGRDVLGEFYEVFLKYGNGAKEIGIVLTPRHITRFAAEVMDIQENDLVLDPACGTGGFLVSALDEVRKKVSTPEKFSLFKQNGLYGVEEQDPIIALAIVNMIFRGDGKTNMIEGNCFNKWLTLDTSNSTVRAKYSSHDSEERIPPITKVLMNPPFSQKSSTNKEHHFIEQALKQMQDGGLLFAVLPLSVMIESSNLQWRKDFLKMNSLLSVVTFPDDLFYPTSTHTLGLFVKKGVPHKKDQNTLWVRAVNDGFVKKKGKRVKSDKVTDDLSRIHELVFNFLQDQTISVPNIPRVQKAAPIDFDSVDFELIPELYVDDKEYATKEIEAAMEDLMRETASYLLRTKEKNYESK